MSSFLKYYRSNRRMQLNADLLAPTAFLQNIQGFVTQVALWRTPLLPSCLQLAYEMCAVFLDGLACSDNKEMRATSQSFIAQEMCQL